MAQTQVTQDAAGEPARLGIFGGTFDPPHLAHLILAQEVALQLHLARVLFVPAGVPPHKQGRAVTPAALRVEMVRLAIADNPRFALSPIEVERAGPSYTVDTLARLRDEYGPQAQLYLILGGDMARDLVNWHDPGGILRLLTGIAAVQRPGFAFTAEDLAALDAQLPGLRAAMVQVVTPQLDISSRMLRSRLAHDLPITYFVPASVETFIRARGLYQNEAEGRA